MKKKIFPSKAFPGGKFLEQNFLKNTTMVVIPVKKKLSIYQEIAS